MSTKKSIIVKVKRKDVNRVLEHFNYPVEKEDEYSYLYLDIEETPENYKFLSTSDLIEEWEFSEEKCCNNTTKEIEIPNSDIEITDYNSAATFIEAVWRVNRRSPGINFDSNLLNNIVYKEYNIIANSPISIDHALLKMIMETFYLKEIDDEIVKDIHNRLEKSWKNKTLGEQLSLAGVSKLLFS